MIVCPNCNHQNPDGAIQCEACLTPLPAMSTCANCGASVQTDATFCGQCGFDLRANAAGKEEQSAESAVHIPPTVVSAAPVAATVAVPPLPAPDPLVAPEPLVAAGNSGSSASEPAAPPPPMPASEPVALEGTSAPPPPPVPTPAAPAPASQSAPARNKTQLQVQVAMLRHVQTNAELELPQHLSVIHLGKPNDMVPPDIDVSGFPNSEIVSRIHADIRVEGDGYYIEDTGSSNGTYINNFPLGRGNRHRLRAGDRIALGKGDMMTFVFHVS